MIRPILLGEIIEKNARLYRKKSGFIFASTSEGKTIESISFGEFNEASNRAGRLMKKCGVKEGDRVAILDYDTIPRVEVEFGAFKIGAIFVPLNWRLKPEEIAFILRDFEPKILIVRDAFIETIELIRKELKSVREFIHIGGEAENWTPYDELTKSVPGDPLPYPGISEDDLAMLIYTAGSTGRPKGVMISHRNLLSVCAEGHTSQGITYGDICFSVSPLFHSGGHAAFLENVYLGNTAVLLETFDPKFVLETIEREKVSVIITIPTQCKMLGDVPEFEKYDLSSLRILMYGASPMPMALLKKLFEVFPNDLEFRQGLSSTETSGWCGTQLHPKDHILQGRPEEIEKKKERLLSAGIPGNNVMIKIGDKDGNEVPIGESGELFLRGAHIMKGYWKNPQATKEAFVDGWFRQPDICKMDEDGYVYLLDRKHNMIISGGENIYPKEIEDVLLEHPEISQAAVIGIPHEKWGETVKAFIVLEEGASLSEKGVMDFCKKHLASFKKPTSVDFVNELPLTGPGKIDKQKLRAPYWGNREKKSADAL